MIFFKRKAAKLKVLEKSFEDNFSISFHKKVRYNYISTKDLKLQVFL